MPSRTILARSIAALCPLLLLAAAASAAPTLYWDADADPSNNSIDGTGLGNSGTNIWDTSGLNWWQSGSGTNQAWTNSGAEIADFIGTAGAISLGTGITAGGLIFDSAGFSLTSSTAQTLTLGSSGILVNATAGATTVGSANLSVALNAAQSWTNNSAGLLTIGGAVSNGGNLLTIGGAGNTTISGVIGAGAGGLTKIGAGTLTVGAATNTFTGVVSVNEGTVSFGNVASLGTNTSMNLGTATTLGTLAYTGATATFAKAIVLAGPAGSATGQTITAPSGTTLTFSGILSGGPGAGAANTALTFTGGGSFAFSAANTYNGNVVYTGAGTKLITSTGSLNGADANSQLGGAGARTFTFSNGAIFNQTSSTINPTAASGKNWVVGTGGATFDIGGTALLQLDDPNQFSGTDDLTKAGTGTLTLGNTTVAYTYSGANVNITGGILKLQNSGALGTVGTINLGATSGTGTATLQISNGTLANTTALVVRSGSSGVKTIGGANTTGTAGFASAVTLNDNVAVDAAAGGTLDLSGSMTEVGGARTITKTGPGVVTLTGTNSYSGGTVISGGTLQFGPNAGTIPATGSLTLNAGGAIAAAGPAGLGSLTEWLASGQIPTSSAGAIAIVANDASNIDFATPGYNSLFLGSAGAFTYTGTITPGTNGYRLGGGSGALTVPNTNALTGANALTIGASAGAAPVVLTGANDFTGTTTVQSGAILTLQNDNALGGTANGTTVAAGGALQLQGGIKVTGEPLTINPVVSTDPLPNVLINVSGNNEWAGPISSALTSGNNTRISSNAGTLTLSGNVTITGSAGQSLVLTGSGNGVLSGALTSNSTTAIIKTGTGTWTLSNASNSFTGATQIQNGAISVPVIAGVLGSGTLIQFGNTTTGATLIYTGTGETSARTLSLIGSTGGGTLQADNASGLLKFTANLTVPGAASTDERKTLTLTGSGNAELVGVIPDAALGTAGQLATAVTKSGAGTWTLSGANTYTGATAITAGVLNLNNTLNSTTGSAVTVSGTGTLNLNAANAVTKSGITVSAGTLNGTIANAISSTATLSVSGGTANLNFDDNYTGLTTVSGGLLKLGSANALPGGIGTAGGTSGLTMSGTGGVIGLAAGDFTRGLGTGATQVQFTGGGGFAAFGADRVVNLGGATAGLTWNTGSFVPTGSALILGHATADKTITFSNPIDLNGAARTIQVDDGSAAVDAILAGTITGSAASSALTKSGAGTLQLNSASNLFTGAMNITNGAVNASDLAQLGGASLALGSSTTVGTLNYSGLTASYAKNVAMSAPTSNATGNTFSALAGTNLTLSGIISGGPAAGAANTALTFTGGGTFIPSGVNTFTGNVVVSGAGTTLVVTTTVLNNADVDSVLGKAGQHSYTFRNGATYSQTANTINPTSGSTKSFLTGPGGGIFEIATGATLQLDDANQFGGTGDLTKAGGGLLLIGNTTVGYAAFTGPTVNVNNGTLRLANSLSLGSATTINLGDTSGSNAPILDIRNSSVIPATTALVVRAGSSGVKTLLNAAANNGLDGPVTLNDSLTTDISATMTLNGAIDGPAGINKTSAGTLVLGGANTFAGPLTITAGTVRFAAEKAYANGVTANWNTTNLVVNSATTAAFNIGGTGEFTGADLDILKTLGSATGGFKTGAILAVDTTNAPGGTFTYSGFVNPGGNTLNVAKTGAGTLELTGLSTHTGGLAVSQGTLRLSAQNSVSGAVNFGGAITSAPTTTTGTLEFGVNNPSLGAINVFTNSATANTLTLAAGQTLTSTGSVTIGPAVSSATTTVLNAVGAGAWNVTGTGLTFRVGGNNATSTGSAATLDLTGLNSFSASLGSGGAFRIANADTTQSGPADINQAILSPNSTITAGTVDIGSSSPHPSTNILLLGTGLNTLNADTFNVSTQGSTTSRSSGKVDFKTAGTGTVKIRGFNTTGPVTNLNILNTSAATNTALTADFLLAGHSADVLVTNLNIAVRNPSSTWAGATNTANFSFDEGSLVAGPVTLGTRGGGAVTTGNLVANMTLGGATAGTSVTFGAMTMANNSASNTASTGTAISTLNISGLGTTSLTSLSMGNNTVSGAGATSGTNATLNVSGSAITFTGTGTPLTMATNNAAAAAGATVATAALNLGGGTMTLNGGLSMANAVLAANTSTSSIVVSGGVLTLAGNLIRNAASLGTENTTLTLNGGTLDLGGFSIGTAAKPIGSGSGSISFFKGTLKNVLELNDGMLLTKAGPDILYLSGTNSYTGGTNVSEGAVIVHGSITGSVTVAANATLGGDGTITPSIGASIAVAGSGVVSAGFMGGADPVGTLTVDGANTALPVLSVSNGATFTFELNTGLRSDKIALAHAADGDLVFGGNVINFTDLASGSLTTGTYTLFTADAPNAYSGLVVNPDNTIASGLTIGAGLDAYPLAALQVQGNDIVLVGIPEPATAGMLLTGAGALLGLRRFRRRAQG